jgi:hypothetical protein
MLIILGSSSCHRINGLGRGEQADQKYRNVNLLTVIFQLENPGVARDLGEIPYS